MKDGIDNEEMISDVAVPTAADVGGAHVTINDVALILVDQLIHERTDLDNIKIP